MLTRIRTITKSQFPNIAKTKLCNQNTKHIAAPKSKIIPKRKTRKQKNPKHDLHERNIQREKDSRPCKNI